MLFLHVLSWQLHPTVSTDFVTVPRKNVWTPGLVLWPGVPELSLVPQSLAWCPVCDDNCPLWPLEPALGQGNGESPLALSGGGGSLFSERLMSSWVPADLR